jgi:hypothetical protein
MMKDVGFAIGAGLILLSAAPTSVAQMSLSIDDDGSHNFSVAGGVLYSQLDDPSGGGFTDQSFEASYAAYDATAADDFIIQVGIPGCVPEVGVINTPGSQQLVGSNPFFVSHAFYWDAGGEPGAVTQECDFPGNTDFTSDGDGDLSTNVGCLLEMGVRMWVSQTVRQDFNPFGQHVWASRAGTVGSPAVWKNPGDGFAVGCVDWEPANAVCGAPG